MAVELWVDKYRSKTLDDYVWQDPAMRAKIEQWIEEGATPNLLLAGKPGTGKTTLMMMLMLLLNIPQADILFIPASKERKIEDIQNKIENFIGTWAMGESGIKYILLDEFDAVTPAAQKMLRTDMETYSDTTRFIATCNYSNKVIPALISRFHVMHFQTLGMEDYMLRIGEILNEENVEWEFDTLEAYVKVTYPDLRKCISLVQHNTIAGKLNPPGSDDAAVGEYLLSVVDLFKKGKFIEARKLIVSQAQLEDYPDIYRFLYQNLDLFGKTPDQQDEALLAIKDGVVQHGLVFDPEINLSATLARLARISKSNKSA